MAPLDASVARVLDRAPTTTTADSDDEDALIAALEEEEDESAPITALRERRLEQLHAELARAKAMKNSDFGTYREIKDEKQVLDITTTTKLCVVHFMKPDFNRCRIMDERLRVLAEKHFDTRFVSVDVENAPFLVVKLGIQVLPCVIAFKDGVSADRIIGFEGIGYKPDTFSASELEQRLLSSGVLVRAKMTDEDDRRRVRREEVEREEVYDDDDDWD